MKTYTVIIALLSVLGLTNAITNEELSLSLHHSMDGEHRHHPLVLARKMNNVEEI